jgi:hypothetical protein
MRAGTFNDGNESRTFTEILIRDNLTVPMSTHQDHLEITVTYRFINKRIVVTSSQAKWM